MLDLSGLICTYINPFTTPSLRNLLLHMKGVPVSPEEYWDMESMPLCAVSLSPAKLRTRARLATLREAGAPYLSKGVGENEGTTVTGRQEVGAVDSTAEGIVQ